MPAVALRSNQSLVAPPLEIAASRGGVLASGTLLVLGFLLRQRGVTRRMADEEDRGALTASDYAVMIEGLHRNQDPDDAADGTPGLQTRLLRDLRGLGLDADADIDHVEVARYAENKAHLARWASQLSQPDWPRLAEAWGCPGLDSATARACRSQIWPK